MQQSGASFLIPYWLRWCASRRPTLIRRSTVSFHAGLLFRQGVPPHATYLFKHALVQDAAYGTLLREPRRALHARIAETLESQFAEIAENQPELLARHCTEAGLIEKAASLWGKAGQRSLERSALVEAVEQFTRALDQIATLPATPALRREQIKLQVALITPLIHVKGYAAPETKAAAERARLLIEQAEALGRASRRPAAVVLGPLRLLGRELRGVQWRRDARACGAVPGARREAGNNGSAHDRRIVSWAFPCCTRETSRKAGAHYDQAIALYDPAEHRPLATRFGEDARCGNLVAFESMALWMLGYPEAALADADHALKDAREIGQAATLMFALYARVVYSYRLRKLYGAQRADADELVALADEKGARPGRPAECWPRLAFGPDRQSRRRGPNDHLRAHRMAVDGINHMAMPLAFVIFGESLCGTRPIR